MGRKLVVAYLSALTQVANAPLVVPAAVFFEEDQLARHPHHVHDERGVEKRSEGGADGVSAPSPTCLRLLAQASIRCFQRRGP
jgi:hypothetical protein